jgi:hypothetical protein
VFNPFNTIKKQTKEAIPMNVYTPFTVARKAMIINMKAMLTSSDFKPYKDPVYGTKYSRLFLADYAVYAVLRGADFRKASHLHDKGAPNAKSAIKSVISSLDYVIEKPESRIKSMNLNSYLRRYVIGVNEEFSAEKSDSYLDSVKELNDLLRTALLR